MNDQKEEMLIGLMIGELDEAEQRIQSRDWDEAVDSLNWVYSQIRRVADEEDRRVRKKDRRIKSRPSG